MIAKIEKDGKLLAVLEDDGQWRAEDDFDQEVLNKVFSPRKSTGVGAVLPFGHHAAMLANQRFGGVLTFAKPLKEMPEGVIS